MFHCRLYTILFLVVVFEITSAWTNQLHRYINRNSKRSFQLHPYINALLVSFTCNVHDCTASSVNTVTYTQNDYVSATQSIQQGMSSFRNNDIQESLNWFEKSTHQYPLISNQLWQKGISQYFVGDYKGLL